MGVNAHGRAKNIILKGLGSLWKKTRHSEEGCAAGHSGSDELERAGRRGRPGNTTGMQKAHIVSLAQKEVYSRS